MLAVQVQYWTLQENKRHNLATENLADKSLSETIRHNTVTEGETQRHNQEQERYWNNSLAESVRHNTVSENIDWLNADTNRWNAKTNERNAATNAFNAATNRLNVEATYALGMDANDIKRIQAEADQQNARTRFLEWGTKSQSVGVDIANSSINEENAQTNRQNADTNAVNAQTNALNAQINQQNADTRSRELELKGEQFEWQKGVDAYYMRDKGINTGLKAIDSTKSVFELLIPKEK